MAACWVALRAVSKGHYLADSKAERSVVSKADGKAVKKGQQKVENSVAYLVANLAAKSADHSVAHWAGKKAVPRAGYLDVTMAD